MDASSLYDLTPAARLLLLGALIAAGPLLWVWLRHRGAGTATRLRALTLLTLFLTFDLTLFGAFTRLTDSGLGCPDWPGCYGNASPLGARDEIHAEQALRPQGPVTHGKAWVEMLHRYLATGVGGLILAIAATTWVASRRERLPVSPAWATATLAWVCLQGTFGALTVTMKLYPAVVTLHLLGAMGLLALLAAQAQAYAGAPVAAGAGLRRALGAVALLVLLQIALGGWVSSNYAVLACQEFPACQGSFWPSMDFAHGFTLNRHLGSTAGGDYLPFAALTAIHYVHRLVAYLVFAALIALAWRLRARGEPALRRTGGWLLALAAWQLATGLGNVLFGWPLLAAVSHTGGADGLVIVLTTTLVRLRAPASPRATAAGGLATPVQAAS